MSKVSSYQDTGLHVMLEMADDGQRLEFDVYRGGTIKKMRYEVGHLHGVAEMFIEQFETENPDDELDIRIRLNIPKGSLERPVSSTLAYTAPKAVDISKLPKAQDGHAWVDDKGPQDTMDHLEADDKIRAAELAATAEIISGESTSAATVRDIGITKLSQVDMERRFQAPKVGEEAELTKLVNPPADVTAASIPTPKEVAEMINTTPPKVGEEAQLRSKERQKRNANRV
jgi:hypothetical protein